MSAMHISHPPGRIRPPAAPLPLFRSLAMLQADMLALTVLCILAILLSACSAGPGPEIMLTDDDSALQEVANAETPAGVDNTLFAELRAELKTTREALVGTNRQITIAEERQAARDQVIDDARAHPLVAAALARFPGAEIVDVRVGGEEPAAEALYEDAISAAAIGAVPDPDDGDDDGPYDDGAPPITEDPNDYEDD